MIQGRIEVVLVLDRDDKVLHHLIIGRIDSKDRAVVNEQTVSWTSFVMSIVDFLNSTVSPSPCREASGYRLSVP